MARCEMSRRWRGGVDGANLAAEVSDHQQVPAADPLARFRSWRGFLLAAIALNALFVWGMWGSVADPRAAAWIKALSWLPFNVIATAMYLVFMAKLARPQEGRPGSAFYAYVCLTLIAANWLAMFVA